MSDDIFRLVVAGGVVLASICFLVQAVATMIVYRRLKHLEEVMVPLAEKTGPILEKMHKAVEDLTPKLKTLSEDATVVVKETREQVARIGELVKELVERVKSQVAKIDGVVDHTVENVQQAGDSVRSAVMRPVREVNGVLSGIKTAISVMTQGRRQSVDHAIQDEEMFI